MSAIIVSEIPDGHLSPQITPESMPPHVIVPVSPPLQHVTTSPQDRTSQLQCLILIIGIPCSILASVFVLFVIYMMVTFLR